MLYLTRSVALAIPSLVFACAFFGARLLAPRAAPRLLRRYLQWCGGGFLKLGQVLSLRSDMLPPAYSHELTRLSDRARRLPVRRIRVILAAELGARAGELLELAPEPIATTSIAQVHGARLADGTEVVVKVRRPGALRRLQIDLAVLRQLARLAELLTVFGGLYITGLVAEIARMSHEELDFRREAFQADVMHRKLAEDELDHRAPAVWLEYSTSAVIVMERFRGVWLRDLITAVRTGAPELAALADRGITPRRTARLVLRSLLTQVLIHGVFHADPEAANIVVFDGGGLGYVDFGMLGRLDERLAGLQLRMLEGISTEHPSAAFSALVAIIEPLTLRDLSPLQTAVQELFASWWMIAAHPAATAAERSFGLFLLRIADRVRRSGLRLPTELMRYYRAQIVCDRVLAGLAPELDPTVELVEFLGEAHRHQLASLFTHGNLLALWRTLAVDGPRAAEQLVRWLDTRLPRFGEAYVNQLSGFERAGAVGVRYLQRGLWLAGAVIAGIAVHGDRAAVALGPVPWWGVTAGLFGLAYTLRRMQQALTHLD